MGAYLLILVLIFWIVSAFSIGDFIFNDAVDAYGEADTLHDNLPLHMLWLILSGLIALPRIIADAVFHHMRYRR